MVNAAETDDWRSVERRLVLSYAPPRGRAALAALLDLDDVLASVLRSTREPMIGQMRLTWWHDALTRLESAAPPAHPVLQALASCDLPGAELARMVEGWEELLVPGTLDDAALMRFGRCRGGTLFTLAARAMGANDEIAAAGAGWALADLARNSRAPGREHVVAAPLLDAAAGQRWSRAGRALGAMVHLARIGDASPRARTARLLWHRVTGR